ncbi:MAG: peptide deformylase [Patescibacteria group bacterium]|nr:peptide deformylase [Patescibacteria group bacterium]
MKIVQAPEAVLSEKAKPIEKIDKAITTLIEEMEETLVNTTDPEGVGLAAPQVGKSLQLFVIKQSKEAPFSVFINPVIETLGQLKETEMEKKHSRLEGCLSLKDIWGTVKRAPKVKVSYIDEHGSKHTRTFDGFFAVIVQHEYDHLQGFLFPKRTLEQGGKLYKSHKNEKGEDEFDPIEL